MLLEELFDIAFCIPCFWELILRGSCTLSVLSPLMLSILLLVTSEVSFAVAEDMTVSSGGCDVTRYGGGSWRVWAKGKGGIVCHCGGRDSFLCGRRYDLMWGRIQSKINSRGWRVSRKGNEGMIRWPEAVGKPEEDGCNVILHWRRRCDCHGNGAGCGWVQEDGWHLPPENCPV